MPEKANRDNRITVRWTDTEYLTICSLAGEEGNTDRPDLSKAVRKMVRQSTTFKKRRKQILKQLEEVKNESILN